MLVKHHGEIEGNPAIERHYSEIIIVRDNKYMVFTILTHGNISIALIDHLNRKENQYVVEDVKSVSILHSVAEP